MGSCFLPSLRIYGELLASLIYCHHCPSVLGMKYETRVSDSLLLFLAWRPRGEELGLLLITGQEQRPASLRESLCTSGSALRTFGISGVAQRQRDPRKVPRGQTVGV